MSSSDIRCMPPRFPRGALSFCCREARAPPTGEGRGALEALGALRLWWPAATCRVYLLFEETWRSALLFLASPDDMAGDEGAHEQEGWSCSCARVPAFIC